MIILDFGSGNTCKNDLSYVQRMIDKLKAVDTGKHEIVIKWQLFQEAGDNIPLDRDTFTYAYNYAAKVGYKTTASVFDTSSLKFLLKYNIPFVKIANRGDLYWLAGEVPRKVPVFASFSSPDDFWRREPAWTIEHPMWCVSKYPATFEEYDKRFGYFAIMNAYPAISDHTTDFELYNKYQPKVYECHYKLENSTGLDAGPFARTPEQLKEIL